MSSDIRTRLAVPEDRLCRRCAPVEETIIADTSDVIGQENALRSVDLGLDMTSGDYAKTHYNIVVVGPSNTGRTTKTLKHLRKHAAGIAAPPPDVLCLHNFSSPRRPSTVFVKNGQGRAIRKKLAALGRYAAIGLPRKLIASRQQRLERLHEKIGEIWADAKERVQAFGHLILEDDERYLPPVFMSVAHPDRPMSQEEYEALDDDIRDKLGGELAAEAQNIYETAGMATQTLLTEDRKSLKKDERKQMRRSVGRHFRNLRQLGGEDPAFNGYLAELEKLILRLVPRLATPPDASMIFGGPPKVDANAMELLRRLTEVNLLVDNARVTHPPVIQVTVPQYSELFGRINAHLSGPDDSVNVDHTMVEGGAFLRANGGYLILDLEDLLRWGGMLTFYKLLQVIRTRKLTIEGKARFVDADPLIDYRSKDIPVDVRVVVVCDQWLVHLLRHYEPEFNNLFRINAEFDDQMDFDEARRAYAAFVDICRADGSLPEVTPEALARLVEYGARRTEDQQKASTEFGIIKDVITEAAHWARQDGADSVGPTHVQRAIDERFERQALLVRRYQEYLDSGHLLFDHDGFKVGQINGLSVLMISPEIVFGIPSRITAQAFAGPEKVLLVQREAGLSGPSMDTAIGVIRGYFSGRYGRKRPLGLAVQLCFEQCYGGIDGDSASLAETVALISAITRLPVDQRLAMTGSMNQLGEAQPIGGANEKIEGHFDALKRRGLLRPGHGTVLPTQNLDNLMLKDEVIEAQRQGLYQIYAVSHIDEALEIFLRRPAKEIHDLVKKRLKEINGGLSLVGLLGILRRRGRDPLDD